MLFNLCSPREWMTSQPPFQNLYHLRHAAHEKPCYVCMKGTTIVLITPDSKDWFYACKGHLVDRNFALPVVDREEEERIAKEKEIARVKIEWEEKKAKKAKTKVEKSKDTAENSLNKSDSEEKTEGRLGGKLDETPAEDKPKENRIYILNREVYGMRTNRIRQAQNAKKVHEAYKSLDSLPSAPKHKPGE
ncbi:UPF0589 protein [Neolecta irregularis DAH-3]|uniref:UPF0589 protein n=1 Tax=Neolecta irregularis (strain DAH-3) TaxID=1198029 RepID=A0A1U7LIT5_NEOID|nr:UPF0589 protein [Neolecta irregularis DAH-3]|eukprot:OLL22565.1 UPF0589 protein [Neolecta irregularis DAH-3]